MQITNDTTTHQVAELMGDEADARDGCIMMSLLLTNGITDTEEVSEGAWLALIEQAQRTRKAEDIAIAEGY